MTSIRNFSASSLGLLFPAGQSGGFSSLGGVGQSISADTLSSAFGAQSGATATRKYAPTAPWSPSAQPNPANDTSRLSEAAKQVLRGGSSFINEDSALLDMPNASSDYKKLFALYNGLNTLSQLAENAKAKSISTADKAQLQKAFQSGVAEVVNYVGSARFDRLRLALGEVNASARSTSASRTAPTAYASPPLVANDPTQTLDALQGDVRFTMQVTRLGQARSIDIDLSSLSPSDRTLPKFVAFVNE